MLISVWLNVSIDPIVGTDQKDKIFWSRIHSYCIQFNANMKKGAVACKKRWYKINKPVAQFASCYDQTSRNIRSGSNVDDIRSWPINFIRQIMIKNSLLRGIEICFIWSKNGEANYLHRVEAQREPRLMQLEHTHHHQIQKHRWLTKPVWTLPFAHKDQRRAREKVRKKHKCLKILGKEIIDF
ncbi:hypothetical protein Ahy_B06g082180 isoform B [Arachis hypogaea]|uniref:RFTS domain-containing protein n=1 Tax=Arachis hypogaea TaxID=3818 RepID=A0A444YMX0_ARAHY|nr:hypothetical protein Ahy_B06g082180 isoform B [Arachis hypogaea]